MMKNDEGHFLHMAARSNEIWAVVYEQSEQISATCEKTVLLAEDLIDKWPHSVPPLPVQKIVQSKPPDQVSDFFVNVHNPIHQSLILIYSLE